MYLMCIFCLCICMCVYVHRHCTIWGYRVVLLFGLRVFLCEGRTKRRLFTSQTSGPNPLSLLSPPHNSHNPHPQQAPPLQFPSSPPQAPLERVAHETAHLGLRHGVFLTRGGGRRRRRGGGGGGGEHAVNPRGLPATHCHEK